MDLEFTVSRCHKFRKWSLRNGKCDMGWMPLSIRLVHTTHVVLLLM